MTIVKQNICDFYHKNVQTVLYKTDTEGNPLKKKCIFAADLFFWLFWGTIKQIIGYKQYI